MTDMIKSPMKAIRTKCLDCAGGSMKEVRECNIEDCALRPYRFGKNPNRRGVGGRSQNELCTNETQLTLPLEEENIF